MTMRTSRAGLLALADHEGVVLSRYKDSEGVWTIGIGHTASAGGVDPKKVSRELTLSEVLTIFREDIVKFERRVNDAVSVPMEQHEFDALVSFDFNTGGIFKARLTRLLNEGKREAAAAAFMGWKKPPEIIGRRQDEQALFRTGVYPEITRLNVWRRFPGNVERVRVPEGFMAGEITPAQPIPDDPGPVTPEPKHWLVRLVMAVLGAFRK